MKQYSKKSATKNLKVFIRGYPFNAVFYVDPSRINGSDDLCSRTSIFQEYVRCIEEDGKCIGSMRCHDASDFVVEGVEFGVGMPEGEEWNIGS